MKKKIKVIPSLYDMESRREKGKKKVKTFRKPTFQEQIDDIITTTFLVPMPHKINKEFPVTFLGKAAEEKPDEV